MKCGEVIACLERHSDPAFAEEWDNVGLLCGRTDKEVQRVFLSLDATEEMIDEAIRLECDMIITHHPVLFRPVKRVTDADFTGRRLVKMLRYDICCYAMHTNFDVMGMADAAAGELQLSDRNVLFVTYEDELSREGIGRTGLLPAPMALKDCATFVKSAFDVPDVRVYGALDKRIEKVAVCPGSGKSMIGSALKGGADCLITGDIDYHTGIDALAENLAVIDAGHYGIEKLFIPYMRDYIHRELKELAVHTAHIREPFVTL